MQLPPPLKTPACTDTFHALIKPHYEYYSIESSKSEMHLGRGWKKGTRLDISPLLQFAITKRPFPDPEIGVLQHAYILTGFLSNIVHVTMYGTLIAHSRNI